MMFGQKRLTGVIICAAVLSLALAACGPKKDGDAGEGTAHPTAEQTAADKAADAAKADKAKTPEAKEDAKDSAEQAKPSQGEQASAANAGNAVDDEVLDAWSKKARAFLTIYPANHVHAGGEGDQPMEMTLEDWASNCLSYIDPESTLGKQLASDPEAVAMPLGFHDAATVVESCEVTGANVGGVNVNVTMKSSQMSWDRANTHTKSYLVQFNNDNLITNVVETH